MNMKSGVGDHFLSKGDEWKGEGDRSLMVIVLALCFFGLIMVYSASSVMAWKNHGDATYFLKKQFLWTFMGIGLFLFFAQVSYRQLREGLIPMTCVVFALLLTVLFLGRAVNGSQRWLRFGPINLQPSEIAKLFVVIYLAHYISKKGDDLSDFFKGLWPVLTILGLLCFLIWREPDLGTTLMILMIAGLLLFIGGASLRHLGWLSGGIVVLIGISLLWHPYMLQRVKTFINPLTVSPAKSFQINQSYIALGSGGLFGTDLGDGRQKLFFLPQPHTDFIFSVIGEELGWLGSFFVVLLFLSILWKGVQITRDVQDPFAQMLAMGMTLLIVMPALMNMGVVTGLLPTKGLSLPFISYGGSSLLVNWGAAGMLYRVSKDVPIRHSRKRISTFFRKGNTE